MRKNSIAFCGGAFGDEGKGRIVDEYVNTFAAQGPVVVYRDNGGANAGHTIYHNGTKVALHQLLSGVFHKQATVILGKGMVLHPGDLLLEIAEVKAAADGVVPATVMIDETAVLSLDTHRAFEAVLKEWQEGGKGATGRGISPAYADVILRHPVRMRDLKHKATTTLEKHYDLYSAWITGLGRNMAEVMVPTLSGQTIAVGTKAEFMARLLEQTAQIESMITDVHQYLHDAWNTSDVPFVFEKAQAIGLDHRWGVYPDVTASDCTFEGIHSSTEGIIKTDDIEIRAAVLKATYMSTVGSRVLPTKMEEELATRIREDANEYGATTKRPRGIAYLDIPALRYFIQVGRVSHLVLTHMDIVYSDVPVKVCTKYLVDGKEVQYRPDQLFLNTVTPEFIELSSWDSKATQTATTKQELPQAAQDFLVALESYLGIPVLMITTGPEREQGILFK